MISNLLSSIILQYFYNTYKRFTAFTCKMITIMIAILITNTMGNRWFTVGSNSKVLEY